MSSQSSSGKNRAQQSSSGQYPFLAKTPFFDPESAREAEAKLLSRQNDDPQTRPHAKHLAMLPRRQGGSLPRDSGPRQPVPSHMLDEAAPTSVLFGGIYLYWDWASTYDSTLASPQNAGSARAQAARLRFAWEAPRQAIPYTGKDASSFIWPQGKTILNGIAKMREGIVKHFVALVGLLRNVVGSSIRLSRESYVLDDGRYGSSAAVTSKVVRSVHIPCDGHGGPHWWDSVYVGTTHRSRDFVHAEGFIYLYRTCSLLAFPVSVFQCIVVAFRI